jgi:hypothetical protein
MRRGRGLSVCAQTQRGILVSPYLLSTLEAGKIDAGDLPGAIGVIY